MHYYNELGYQIDQNGDVLNNRYNQELYASYCAEEEEEERLRALERDRNNGYAKGAYLRGANQNYGGNIYDYQQSFNRHPALGRAGGGTIKPKRNMDLDDDYDDTPPPKQSNNRHKSIASLNKSIDENEHTEIVSKKNIIYKPVDNIYHDPLLNKNYECKKILLPVQSLDENTNIQYFKREILFKGDEEMNSMSFGEELFNSGGFKPLSVESIDIEEMNAKELALIVESGDDLMNQLLYIISEKSKTRDYEKVYTLDGYIVSTYFNDTGKNLFTDELSKISVSSTAELMATLKEYYLRYYNRDETRNGIKKIDEALTKSANAYIAAYAGTAKYKLVQFMPAISDFCSKVTGLKDNDLKRNILTGVNNFLLTMVSSIKEYVEIAEVPATELCFPTKEIIAITKNKTIDEEINAISDKSLNEFYTIDRVYSPVLHDIVSRLDKQKVLQKYNRLILFNFKNMYTIIKTPIGGQYYIANYSKL